MSQNDSGAAHVAHPEPNYIAIFIILTILTALEVGVVFLPIPQGAIAALLVVMALTKAGLVAAYFMHLRFETKTLAAIAVSPLVLCTFLLLMLMPDAG